MQTFPGLNTADKLGQLRYPGDGNEDIPLTMLRVAAAATLLSVQSANIGTSHHYALYSLRNTITRLYTNPQFSVQPFRSVHRSPNSVPV